MAEAGRFLTGGTTIVLMDDYVERDPEEVKKHLENIGRIRQKSLREERRRKRGEADGSEREEEEGEILS